MRRLLASTWLPLLAALVIPVLGASAGASASGDPARGQALFLERECGRCHLSGGAQGAGPPTESLRRRQGAMELSGRLWSHAPAMYRALTKEGIRWPAIGEDGMAHLMAYLLADPARDAPPNPVRGRALLVRKGCLKCHRFRGEGGNVAVELTSYREAYQSAPSWASAIWNHSPKMAEHAERMGLLYPRFSGEEMGDLFGFLRSAAELPR